MDLSTTIIGLLLMALFLLPIVFIARTSRGKGRKYEKELFSEVSLNHLTISEKDMWNEYAIGIDESNKRIIYIDWSGSESVTTVFNLNDVKTFTSVPHPKNIKDKNLKYYKNAGRLGLRFTFKESAAKELYITFFLPGFGQLSEEDVKLFEKWTAIVEKNIVARPVNIKRTSA